MRTKIFNWMLNLKPSAVNNDSPWVSFRLISQDGNDGQVHERDA